MTSTRSETVDGAHVDAVVVDDDEIAALDQLDAHLLGQEGVLEVGRVVDTGGEHHHRRIVRLAASQRGEQFGQPSV